MSTLRAYLAIAMLLAAKANAQDLHASAWYTPCCGIRGEGEFIPLYDNTNGRGFHFNIPFNPNSVHVPPYPGMSYVMTAYTPPALPTSVSMIFTLTNNSMSLLPTVFHSVDDPPPCHMRPMLQASETMFFSEQSIVPYEFRRWWPQQSFYTLDNTNGYKVQIVAPINPHTWSSVYGKTGDFDSDSLYWFNYAMNHIIQVGWTAGGSQFYGHGVTIEQGAATFTLLDYSFTY